MVEIVLCTDENYVMPTAILMSSIAQTTSQEDIHYNIISTGLSEKTKEILNHNVGKSSYGITFYTIENDILKDCPIRPGEHVSLATYFRLLLPTILPENISKILYLDGDIICVHDIQPLWDTDLESYAAAAVPDMRCNDIRILNRLQLPVTGNYFNAGVMLINLSWWRQNDVQNKTLQFIVNNPDKCKFHDQDALNFILQGFIKELPFHYNLQEHFFEPFENQLIDRHYFKSIEDARRNPTLIHYTGFKKPWHQECVNPLKSIWMRFYYKSEWGKRKIGRRYKGLKHIKYNLREALARFGFVKSKNIYKCLDFTKIEQDILKKLP